MISASALERDGIAIVHLLGPAELDMLADGVRQLAPETVDGFWTSARVRDVGRRREAHDFVRGVLEAPLERCLPGHRAVLCSLALKPPGEPRGEVPLHQDWSFVDESRSRSLNAWVPLTDVDGTNGCLGVVRGSHRRARQPRGPGAPFAFPELEDMLRARYLEEVPLLAGHAAVFDHCLFHCSPPNTSAHPRVAATAVLLPEGEPLLYQHLVRSPDGLSFETYEVPDDTYLLHEPGTPPPDGRLVDRHLVRPARTAKH